MRIKAFNSSFKGHRVPEPIPTDFGQKADYTLDWSPVNHRTHIETERHSHSQSHCHRVAPPNREYCKSWRVLEPIQADFRPEAGGHYESVASQSQGTRRQKMPEESQAVSSAKVGVRRQDGQTCE
ncbi:uncharacterized protein LOC144078651 [Stigmatopora argus]